MAGKFHGNILNLSENIAKFKGAGGYFYDSHCIVNTVTGDASIALKRQVNTSVYLNFVESS